MSELPTLEELEAGTSVTCGADDFVMELDWQLQQVLATEGEIEGLSHEFFGALWRVTTLGREDLKRAKDYIESVEHIAERLLWRFDDQQVAAGRAGVA